MLIEHTEYRDSAPAVKALDGNSVFRYCAFQGFSVEGGHVDGLFYGCTFEGLEWYWGLFNGCVFVQSKFKSCTFRGTAFPDCRFVECEFIECRFLGDNLGGGCSAEGAAAYDSKATHCEGAEFLFTRAAESER